MAEDGKLNLEAIAEKYSLLDTMNTYDLISRITKLDEVFCSEDLIKIYNYILTNSKSVEVLMHVIALADRFRNYSTLSVLVDMLLLKNTDNLNPQEKESYINLRVMCAKAIANYRDTSAVTPLLYCLNNKDENYKVRFACADALYFRTCKHKPCRVTVQDLVIELGPFVLDLYPGCFRCFYHKNM